MSASAPAPPESTTATARANPSEAADSKKFLIADGKTIPITASHAFLRQTAYLFLIDINRCLYKNTHFDFYDKNEPGYGPAMFAAYQFAFHCKKPPRKLTHEFIQGIHQRAMAHRPQSLPGRYKIDSGFFRITSIEGKDSINVTPSMTIKGLEEFITRWLVEEKKPIHTVHLVDGKTGLEYVIDADWKDSTVALTMGKKTQIIKKVKYDHETHFNLVKTLLADQRTVCTINAPDDTYVKHCGYPSVETAITEKMQRIYDSYETAISKTTNAHEKATVITQHAQLIIQLHPFLDGNTRTAYIAMNALLPEEGLPCTLLMDPNRLDMFDLDLLTAIVERGQQWFVELTKGNLPEFVDCYEQLNQLYRYKITLNELPIPTADIDLFLNAMFQINAPGHSKQTALVLESFFAQSRRANQNQTREIRKQAEVLLSFLEEEMQPTSNRNTCNIL